MLEFQGILISTHKEYKEDLKSVSDSYEQNLKELVKPFETVY